VANIKGAVGDKTAKDLLGESFRRQFVDGRAVCEFVFYTNQKFNGDLVKN